MNYIAIKDLKKTKDLHASLARDHELVLTRNGTPCALMIEIKPDSLEQSLAAIRRALFTSAVSAVREKSAKYPVTDDEISGEIRKSRKERGLSS
ncbi:MAG TPA: hypothetical protein DCZ94_14085 [Lentisphaeria bacterium]|nr:MAG: hypothetical protein A2X48_10180 [Lentisphaerae bacterium GWF2_49_21]HBC88075.1 hypothetical protein [Lentisphaeria bacterium]